MQSLSVQNVEAELSYAYLHAVAARAKVICCAADRHEDNNGVDARLTAYGTLAVGGKTEVDIKVQLKATVADPNDDGERYSYFLKGVGRYDDLRAETVNIPRILVVLFLPKDPAQWLSQGSDELILRRCAYWESLRGAPPSENGTGQTVYLPKNQVFDCDGLAKLVERVALDDYPVYPKLEGQGV